jgi:hypothetical protein
MNSGKPALPLVSSPTPNWQLRPAWGPGGLQASAFPDPRWRGTDRLPHPLPFPEPRLRRSGGRGGGSTRSAGSAASSLRNIWKRSARYGREGATIGTLMAEHLAPVLCCGEEALHDDFSRDGGGAGREKAPISCLRCWPRFRSCWHRMIANLPAASSGCAVDCLRPGDSPTTHASTCPTPSLRRPSVFTASDGRTRPTPWPPLPATSSRFVEPFLDGLAAGAATLAEPALRRICCHGPEAGRRQPRKSPQLSVAALLPGPDRGAGAPGGGFPGGGDPPAGALCPGQDRSCPAARPPALRERRRSVDGNAGPHPFGQPRRSICPKRSSIFDNREQNQGNL